MGWVTADAPRPAELDACVSCGLCLPHCPTYRLTGDETASPRGRLAAMSAVADGVAEVDGTFEEIMGFCLQCRACEAVCPSLVPFGRAMEGARVEIAAQRPATGRKLRHAMLGRGLASRPLVKVATTAAAVAQRVGLDATALPLVSRARGLRPLDVAAPSTLGRTYGHHGEARRGTAALLAGCVMDPWFADVHQATIGVLRVAGYDVTVPDTQTCCGALAAHDGAAAETRRLAERNVAAFADADVVVVDAAGCGAHLKEYADWASRGAELAGRVVDVTEVVAGLLDGGVLPRLSATGMAVAVQDPCHLRHAQRIIEAPRDLIRAAGYDVVEIDPDGLCCGAAGIYTVMRPEASDELGRRKAEQVREAGPTIVASANPGCEMQLRSHLGDDYIIRHPVELYFLSLRSATE